MSLDRTLIVTGASRGLGRHIAEQATDQGYRVIGLARSVNNDAPFDMIACDVSDDEQVAAAFKQVRKDKNLYGLVNAAGIASMNLVLFTPPETMRRIIGVNLLGTMFCSQAMGKILARRKLGRIINFSTVAVPIALAGEAAYVASKAGVEGFSRTFARELSEFSVTVNTIAPGPIPTDLTRNVPKEALDKIVDRQIIQRAGTPQDVWNIARYLLSDDAAMVSGQTINVGGA